MEKIMKIEGMMCMHCVSHVKKALESIPGVKADVDLEKNEARVEVTPDTDVETLKKAVSDAGYEVVSVS